MNIQPARRGDFIIILPTMAWPILKLEGLVFLQEIKSDLDNGFETFTIKDPFKQAMVAERNVTKD